MRRAVLDTSIFVAREEGRELEIEWPERVAVSVVTLAELEQGILMARDDAARARRLETLVAAREEAEGLEVDQRVASAYAQLAADASRAGRRPRVNDTWIAATAHVHKVPVVTQDEDFHEFEGVEIVLV